MLNCWAIKAIVEGKYMHQRNETCFEIVYWLTWWKQNSAVKSCSAIFKIAVNVHRGLVSHFGRNCEHCNNHFPKQLEICKVKPILQGTE